MPIQVTCPGCLARFSVSDKYAGQVGPCPKCKKQIKVPDKSQEVVIHAPEVGPKDSKGVSILKPLRRKDFKLTKAQLGIAAGSVALALLLAIVGRFAFPTPPWWYLAFGAIALAFPIAWTGYTFLRDDELGGFTGQELWIRLGVCAAVFALTWGIYWGIGYYLGNTTLAEVDTVTMAVLLAIMIGIGTSVSLGAMELEFSQSFLHYGFYLAVSFLLAIIAGAEIAEPLSRGTSNASGTINAPKSPGGQRIPMKL